MKNQRFYLMPEWNTCVLGMQISFIIFLIHWEKDGTVQSLNHPKFFVDSDSAKSGTMVDGIAVISVEELSQKYKEYLVVLGSVRYAEEMHQSLLSEKFPKDKILRPQYGILIALCGNQYFDVFSVGEKEIFIDGGGYNGDTSLGFIDWTDGDYSKICVFEPFGEMFQYIKKRVKEK